MKDENCIFCKIVANEIPSYKVYEDENFFGFMDLRPVTKGHMLLLPKYHVGNYLEMEDEIYSQLLLKSKELATKIKEIMDVERVGLLIEGYGVDHVHVHIIPIIHAHQMDGTNKYDATEDELVEMQSLYKF